MGKLWRKLYSKVRADLSGTLATGALGTAVLYVLEAMDVSTSADQKGWIIAAGAYVGGKLAAYIRPETGPVVQTPTPPTPDGGR